MKVLVVGSGGREHTLCWRLAQSNHHVLCAPGNAGIASEHETAPVAASDVDGLVALALERGCELVVIGPEAPLVAGLADRLREREIAVFGPGASGARLEGSKKFCKEFFVRHGIPTGDYRACTTMAEARAAVEALGDGVVVKADGLAAGKGVVVCSRRDEALEAAREMLEEGRFGDASRELVIEERLIGRELSVMAITDGKNYRLLATAEDHKAVFDGDEGPNTGGMGAVSPASWATEELLARVRAEVFEPTLAGLAADGIDFRGVLYAGLMITEAGPKMLEYNVRFGDPETEAVLPRLRGDFGALLYAAACGQLPAADLEWDPRTTVGVILASAGYPGSVEGGKSIRGLSDVKDALVFHAGTEQRGDEVVTAGGRVLAVVGIGDDLGQARERAYAAVAQISFDGAHYRRDIGGRSTVVGGGGAR